MRTFLIVLSLLSCPSLLAQNALQPFDWAHLEYTSARAYLYALQGSMEMIVVDGKLHPTVVDTNGVLLSKAQADTVINVVTGNNGGESFDQAFCFTPHHGIVFYNEAEQIMAHVTICFSCGQIKATPYADIPPKGLNLLKEIIQDCELPILRRMSDYMELGKQLEQGK